MRLDGLRKPKPQGDRKDNVMVATWYKSYRVTSPNTVLVDGNRPVYLPYCPLPGKDEDCKEALSAILEADAGMVIVTNRHSTSNPLIYDVRTEKDNQPISEILVAKDLAIEWNIPSERGVVVEFSVL